MNEIDQDGEYGMKLRWEHGMLDTNPLKTTLQLIPYIG